MFYRGASSIHRHSQAYRHNPTNRRILSSFEPSKRCKSTPSISLSIPSISALVIRVVAISPKAVTRPALESPFGLQPQTFHRHSSFHMFSLIDVPSKSFWTILMLAQGTQTHVLIESMAPGGCTAGGWCLHASIQAKLLF